MNKFLVAFATITVLAVPLARAHGQQGAWGRPQGNPEKRIQRFFEHMDADGDGKISKDEFRGRPEMFDRRDSDGDGFITLDEFKKTMRRPENMGGAGGMGGRGDRHGRGGRNPLLDQLDSNKDGNISKEEWQAGFAALDKDGDGKLSPRELRVRPKGRRGGKNRGGADKLKKMDTDGDGKISKREFLDGTANKLFSRLDADSDGFVTKEEAEAMKPKHRGPRGQGPGGPPGGGPQGRRPKVDLFEQHDTDGDGKLSKEEFSAGFIKHFERIDANGDGYITEDELPKRPKGGERGRGGRKGGFSKKALERFNRFDRDGDGLLSQDEAPRMLRDRFTEIDANDDGFLSQDEVKAAAGDPGSRRNQAAPKYITDNDADGDGKLSFDEFAGSKSDFDSIDTNSDGFITAEELRNSRR